MTDFRDYGDGIFAFDSGYVRPLLAAIHMVVERGRVAFIDTGNNQSLLVALEVLKRLGLSSDAVDWVALTHVHLDHAGGAGSFMRAFPKASLAVHPRGARHMADPEKLLAGVAAVYGAEYVERVYGEILPIPEHRIVALEDEESFFLAGRKFRCLDTPGHARHHMCIVDEATGGVFTGDTFGLSYRETDVGGQPFLFPTTTPTQFDPDALERSIRRIVCLAPPAVYLTHYGRLADPGLYVDDLLRRMHAQIAFTMAQDGAGTGQHDALRAALEHFLLSELRDHGCTMDPAAIRAIWETDIELNAQGLLYWRNGLVKR